MRKGKKTTIKYDRRINIRVSAADWHKIMLRAEREHLPPSTWIRKEIMNKLNGEG